MQNDGSVESSVGACPADRTFSSLESSFWCCSAAHTEVACRSQHIPPPPALWPSIFPFRKQQHRPFLYQKINVFSSRIVTAVRQAASPPSTLYPHSSSSFPSASSPSPFSPPPFLLRSLPSPTFSAFVALPPHFRPPLHRLPSLLHRPPSTPPISSSPLCAEHLYVCTINHMRTCLVLATAMQSVWVAVK